MNSTPLLYIWDIYAYFMYEDICGMTEIKYINTILSHQLWNIYYEI